jgi:hypothetical protein
VQVLVLVGMLMFMLVLVPMLVRMLIRTSLVGRLALRMTVLMPEAFAVWHEAPLTVHR